MKYLKVAENAQTSDQHLSSVPEHLQGLNKERLQNLKTSDEKRHLVPLLSEHRDAFAKSPANLGRCSILKHKKDVAGAAPLRQPMRRTPQGFEKEEEKYLFKRPD